MTWQFGLLGSFQIRYRGELRALPPYRTHSLLAALLLYPHYRYRHQWVGLLFPDMPEVRGRRRLSDLLYLLRQALPDLPLEIERDCLHMAAEDRWLDVDAFRQAAAQDGLVSWQKALDLYRGELLTGYGIDWLLELREILHLQWVQLSHQVCQSLWNRQDYASALPLASQLVQAEPFDEDALRMLMQLYRALGRRGAALSAYERFVSLATTELGISPEPATQQLYQLILEGLPRVPLAALPGTGAVRLSQASADELLCLAHAALDHGDQATVAACLDAIAARFPGQRELETCLLHVDQALFFQEYDQAERLLAACDPDQLAVTLRRAYLAYQHRDWTRAQKLATEALMEAYHAGDPASEIRALLTLGSAQAQQGGIARSLRSIERALQLAQAHGRPRDIAQALVLLGRRLILQAQSSRAGACLDQALAIAQENALPRLEGRAWRTRGWILLYKGELVEAQRAYQRSLDIWRDLGLPRMEATLLHELAEVMGQVGQTAEGICLMEQAQAVRGQFDDPVGLAICRYNLVYALLAHSDALATDAAAIAEEVLETFTAHGQHGWTAATLAALGYARWVAGHFTQALPALQESFRQHQQLGESGMLPELAAHQAIAYLGLGRATEALACTRQALLQLAQEVVPEMAIAEVYGAHALASAAQGEAADADTYFQRAYEKSLQLAKQLQDESARQAFFRRDPMARRLMREVYARGIASPPSAGLVKRQLPSVTGRASVEVTWTVDAGPADQSLKCARGAIGLRRARLQRLLDESRAQGAHPHLDHLAQVLGVSTRTIRRDLAALRNG